MMHLHLAMFESRKLSLSECLTSDPILPEVWNAYMVQGSVFLADANPFGSGKCYPNVALPLASVPWPGAAGLQKLFIYNDRTPKVGHALVLTTYCSVHSI